MNSQPLPPPLPGCGACGSLQIRPVHNVLTEEEAQRFNPGCTWASTKARFTTDYLCRKCGHNRTNEWENLYGRT